MEPQPIEEDSLVDGRAQDKTNNDKSLFFSDFEQTDVLEPFNVEDKLENNKLGLCRSHKVHIILWRMYLYYEKWN